MKEDVPIMTHPLSIFVYYLLNYLTSSKLVATDYKLLTFGLVQIRNAISILNVINQQISRSIRVMPFLFFLVLFSVFLSFVGAKVQRFLYFPKPFGQNLFSERPILFYEVYNRLCHLLLYRNV